MHTPPFRLTAAGIALCAFSPPGHASSADWAPTVPVLALAVLGLLLAGWGFHALLRRRLGVADRLAELEAELGVERHARAQAERALGDAHSTLCKLVRQQNAVRETERNRIARDIHDDLGQSLLALKIELSLLQLSTRGAHPLIHEKLRAMAASLDLSVTSLRAVINDLRPLALHAGLQHAIEWQLGEFSRINGIRHELTADADAFAATRDTAIDAMLFRILQESLSNVVRHARASLVRIALSRNGSELTLVVQDDGIGMASHVSPTGCGLAGIKDRVCAIGGCFAIDSRPGAGTQLSMSIPLAQSIPSS